MTSFAFALLAAWFTTSATLRTTLFLCTFVAFVVVAVSRSILKWLLEANVNRNPQKTSLERSHAMPMGPSTRWMDGFGYGDTYRYRAVPAHGKWRQKLGTPGSVRLVAVSACFIHVCGGMVAVCVCVEYGIFLTRGRSLFLHRGGCASPGLGVFGFRFCVLFSQNSKPRAERCIEC